MWACSEWWGELEADWEAGDSGMSWAGGEVRGEERGEVRVEERGEVRYKSYKL